MAGAKQLGEYVKWVMKLKGLTQKDVQRLSGWQITDGYVASITTGRAGNLSVDKLRALADGLGVDLDDLFHVASGRTQKPDEGKNAAEINDHGLPAGQRVPVTAGTPINVCSYMLRILLN